MAGIAVSKGGSGFEVVLHFGTHRLKMLTGHHRLYCCLQQLGPTPEPRSVVQLGAVRTEKNSVRNCEYWTRPIYKPISTHLVDNFKFQCLTQLGMRPNVIIKTIGWTDLIPNCSQKSAIMSTQSPSFLPFLISSTLQLFQMCKSRVFNEDSIENGDGGGDNDSP